MRSLTITKTGRVEFDAPIKDKGISLKSITLFLSIFNLTETTIMTRGGETYVIEPGYYTYEQIREKLKGHLKIHKTNLQVSYSGTLTGGLVKLIENNRLYLTPLALYLKVDGIDTEKNLLDGKRSNLLSVIPVGSTNVGEIFEYQPEHNYKKMYAGRINSLTVSITDDRGNDYLGKFVAEIQLQ
jgi:hypothetical protein